MTFDIIEGAARTVVWCMIGYGLYGAVRSAIMSAKPSETEDATEE